MNIGIAVAISLGGWIAIGTSVWAQGLPEGDNRTPQGAATVNDVPQGTTGEAIDIVPDIPNPFAPPTQIDRTDFNTRFLTETAAYRLYQNNIFETPIGEDNVRLQVEFEPYRDGGNLRLGLPLE
ncbi:MAG: hypothetical protein SWY16_24740 [Cyanobacteriota bacterium]|nr:hypothetical protein [Cyanobacteriota bacterium]